MGKQEEHQQTQESGSRNQRTRKTMNAMEEWIDGEDGDGGEERKKERKENPRRWLLQITFLRVPASSLSTRQIPKKSPILRISTVGEYLDAVK